MRISDWSSDVCSSDLFPLLGLALQPLGHAVLTPELYLGLLFVCTLPSTVQSSIAFTSIAGGNVSAAVVSASMSNLLGIVLTPLLVGQIGRASCRERVGQYV